MEQQSYRRPPIVEAIIEIRFGEAVDFGVIEAASKSLRKHYPNIQPLKSTSLNLNLSADGSILPSNADAPSVSFRHTTSNQSQIAVTAPISFLVSQLPDYPGWGEFFTRFQRDWAAWKQVANYRKIAQIGVRYINRLDLPVNGPVVINEEYLCIYPTVPAALGPSTHYALQTKLQVPSIKAKLLINSGVLPSPLLSHMSILLDIELTRSEGVPQRDEELFAYLEQLRVEKNRVFEACVTDKARGLFEL